MFADSSRRTPTSRPSQRDVAGIVDALAVPALLLRAVRDDEGRVERLRATGANAAARSALSLAPDDDDDVSLALLARCDPADGNSLLRALRAVVADAVPLQRDLRLRPADNGGLVRAEVRATKVGDGALLTWTYPGVTTEPRGAMLAARSDADRLSLLQRVTTALMGANDVDEVARVILEELFGAKPLVTGVVGVVDSTSDSMRIAASRGLSEDVERRHVRMSMGRQLPLVVAARTGLPEWFTSRAELLAAYPSVPASEEQHTRSVAVLPLEADLGPVGAIAISFSRTMEFDDDLKGFLMTLARQCARAIERGLLLESERVARVRAARLQRVTEGLAGAEQQEAAARAAVGLLEDALEASAVGCYLLTPDDAQLRLAAQSRPSSRTSAFPERVPVLGLEGLARCVREKQAVYAGAEQGAADDPPPTGDRDESRAYLPLLREGRAVGALALSYPGGRLFPADDRAYFGAVAHQLSLALDRARLREENARRSRHLATLAEASASFAAAALDVTALAGAVARFAHEAVGDTAALLLVADDDAHLDVVAVQSSSAEHEALLWQLLEARPLCSADDPIGSVVLTGAPLFLPVVDAEVLRERSSAPWREVALGLAPTGLVIVPLRAHGKILGALCVARSQRGPYTRDDLALLTEIGGRAALSLHSARLYDETQGAVRVRDDFLSIAGHELRTPLTALHLQLQALVRFPERAASPEVVRERARKMAQQTDRLARLITELLDVSRIVRGRLSLEIADVDLVEVVHNVVEMCEADLRRSGCRLELSLPATLVGHWDRTRLEQVLQNLILNACKYGRSTPVELIVQEEGERAVIIVRDRGIGILPDDQARIFERFERAVPSRHFGGFGLGLWISREVVEAHDGTISVQSAPGEGATFRVELPLTRPATS